MSSRTVPATFFPSIIFGTTILSSTIKLSTESTLPSATRQSSLDVDSQDINSTDFKEQRLQYLSELQAHTTIIMIPAIVFLLLLAITGLIGNSLVMFVYSRKFQRSPTRIIIISIAVFDLVSNVLAIPGDIYGMFHYWDFDNRAFCRARLFFSAFTTLSSAMALLAVAVVRYRKICTPHKWQITIGKSKIISIVIASLGVLFSIPYAIINGRQKKKTPRPDIFGYECTIDDTYVGTKWPLLNNSFFLVLFVVSSVALTVLYILIGIQAWKHSKRHGVSSTAVSNTITQTGEHPSSEINESEQSQANNTSSIARDMEQSDSPDITSTSNTNIERKHVGETVEHLDQYRVRIFNDRVVIRTPMMVEIVVELQKATSGLLGVPNNHDVSAEVLATQIENINDLNKDMNCHCISSVHEDEHSIPDLNKAVQNDVVNSDLCMKNDVVNNDLFMKDEKTCLNSTNVVSETDHNTSSHHTDHRTEIPTPVPASQPEQIKSPTKQRTDEPTLTTNSEISAEPNENTNFGPKTPTRCKNSWEEMTSDKHSLHSLASDFSQASCDLDSVAALKWVDIVYSHEGGQTTDSLETPKAGNSISFRISPSNNLLQKADWLRNIIAEALSKSSPRSGRPGETIELNSLENVEIKIQQNGNAISAEECPRESTSCVDSSQPHTSGTRKSRLKEIITKKSSTLKNVLQRRISNRRIISRTTVMLIIISAIYILGFLPFLGLSFYRFSITNETFASMTTAGLTAFNLFVRTFYLNCAANPIIYSMCDLNFRRECIGLLWCFSRG